MTSVSPAPKARNTSLRKDIIRVLTEQGPMTSEEVASILGVNVLHVRPRIAELKRAGLVRNTGEKKRKGNGRAPAVVRIVVPDANA